MSADDKPVVRGIKIKMRPSGEIQIDTGGIGAGFYVKIASITPTPNSGEPTCSSTFPLNADWDTSTSMYQCTATFNGSLSVLADAYSLSFQFVEVTPPHSAFPLESHNADVVAGDPPSA